MANKTINNKPFQFSLGNKRTKRRLDASLPRRRSQRFVTRSGQERLRTAKNVCVRSYLDEG